MKGEQLAMSKRPSWKISHWFIIAICGLMMTSGCSFKPKTIGSDNELAILIDPDLRGMVENFLLEVFCPIVETPQPERRFIPQFSGFEELGNHQRQEVLLIVGTLDGGGEISQFIRKILSPEVQSGVESGDYFIFEKRNEWARGQQMLILVATDVPTLKERLQTESKSLYQILDDHRSNKIKEELYSRLEEKKLAQEIRERYGFDLRIPHDYSLVREEPEEGWLRLKRLMPERWITLWRSPIFEEDPVDSAWAVAAWSQLTSKFADPLRMNWDYLRLREADVSGYPGLEMRGLWETVGPQGGGPFVCYLFFHPEEKRVYLLEGEVYNPSGDKEPFLKQVEIILGTFQVRRESTY